MRKTEIAAILILYVVLVGCGAAFKVSYGEECKKGKCPGVPFYTKAVACNHETVWLEPTYILTLVGTQKPEAPKPGTKPGGDQPDRQEIVLFKFTKEISQYALISTQLKNDFQKFIQRVISQNPDGRDAPAILSAFNILPEYTLPLEKDKLKLKKDSLILASNRNEIYTFVDYSNPYYFNAKVPFSGSVYPEINLSSDLTLSKVSVNVQEKTFETSMGVLSSAVSGMGAAMFPAKEVIPEKPPTPILLQLTIEPRVYQYKLSTLLDSNAKLANPPCKYLEPLFDLMQATTFSRMVMAADESGKKEDEGNKLKFSGSVDLPKAQPAAGK